MGVRSLIAVLAVGLTFGMVACSKDPQKIVPDTRGKRGETCLARNDCDSGLACISGICAKNEFKIDVAVKVCERVECDADTDCCGEKPLEAPTKCRDRDLTCDPANQFLPDCTPNTLCTDLNEATVCGDGACGAGTCSNTFAACTDSTDCADTCVSNGVSLVCSSSGLSCVTAADCAPGTCNNRRCACTNPDYDPTDPICSDPECEDVCLLRCENQLCVEDDSCEVDSDCFGVGLQYCDGGRCVQCTADADCDEEAEETCESGMCKRPCKYNEECGLFEQCNEDTGDCEYVGCRDSRECILAAARGQNGTGGNGNVSSGDDPRMFECLPSDTVEDINVCKIPCENDGSCGQSQVCDAGYCRFIGCEVDGDCIGYLGLSNQTTSEAKPYVTQARCVDPLPAD